MVGHQLEPLADAGAGHDRAIRRDRDAVLADRFAQRCAGKRRGETAGRGDGDEVVVCVEGADPGDDLLSVVVA